MQSRSWPGFPLRSSWPNWAAAAAGRLAGYWRRWRGASPPSITLLRYHPPLSPCVNENFTGSTRSASWVSRRNTWTACAGSRRESGQRLLVLFLGSSIGNFDRQPGEEFLRGVRQTLAPGDALLLGADLEKPVSQMIRAYDDPIGVTAAFNLNLLARINRELDGDFALSQFRHVARYDTENRRIEMHLLATVNQAARIRKAGLTVRLREGETLWTESSHKYNREEVVQMGERAGFRCDGQWVDLEWPFAQSLFIA